MPSSTMWIRVVQTTAIQIAGLVLSHHTKDLVYNGLSNDPVFSDFWSIMANSSSPFNATHNSIANATSGPLSLPTGTHGPVKGDGSSSSFTTPNVAANWTFDAPGVNPFNAPEDNPVSFYKKTLPMKVISCLVLSIFHYCWLVGLERAFPARSLKTNVPVKEKVGLDDPHEEEIVQTWIARGRVRRTSLSWCNTCFKWVLNLTVGRLGLITLSCILRRSLGLKGSPQAYEDHMFREVAYLYVCSFLSIDAIVELLAFIVIPASKQLVFLAGADLVFDIFVATVMNAVSSWAIKTDLVQYTLGNMTRARLEAIEQERLLLLSRNEL